jgi:hypothetical protein
LGFCHLDCLGLVSLVESVILVEGDAVGRGMDERLGVERVGMGCDERG